ncbi:outer membrane lipid asymmetry maintenance protein MlaD [Pseudomonadales bacterium]|nr:outer membrane lipid asymmetry maintenance protein MlaD [Pseudomonadales bacterium]MDA9297897.1 outer membrane lipid asymmetry maintenance protein MlaD [Pseudomonadales bacterium]MDA9316005.1 outer membrane lipid asymmetry maintenance protein MlaD [Pseudomonadales bacterium]MDB4151301.1 outer membrane lipid asymmetry maintenance protein MlaD [Pseudomonadales bacterium]MDB9869010.1 outer membrane lipid asymmetry maintenance protein MlaD [Pseudomonadales bacterium]|tara:strand:- start:303 stop:755 length:453 start_codon:yes stop_codon:yes gene_type:complete
MQMRTIEIVVGAFMLAGLISLAVLAIRVSGFNVGAETNTYSVFAKFENVGGLVVRAKVSIAGVIVGQVAEISLDQESFTALVRMEIDSDVAKLSIDSTAAILTEGLLGGKFIGLTIGADEAYLKDGAYITDTQSSIVLEDMIGKFLMKQF